MLKNVFVPESSLPSALEEDNTIKINYKTNLLVPVLGPIEAAGFIWPATRTVFALSKAASLMNDLKRFFEKPIEIIATGDPIEKSILQDDWRERFVRPIEIMAKKEREMLKKSSGRETLSRPTRLLLNFTAPNVVIRDLFNKELLIDSKNKLGNNDLLKSSNIHATIMAKIANIAAFKEKELKDTEQLALLALQRVDRATAKHNLVEEFKKDEIFRKNLCGYLLEKHINQATLLGLLAKDRDISVTREWAFQRYETLAMGLGQPVLRGPVNATPVAPKSRLTISEHESKAIFEEYNRTSQQGKRLGFSSTAVSSERYRQALDNLSEYGISDETSFAQEATLRSSLSEQRRLTIDRISQEISSEIQDGFRSGSMQASSRSSEYVTEGKDQKLATTELKYQVVLPTHNKVLLNDISVAWCPQVSSPFMKLHGLVEEYEREQKALFLAQSYVPLPAMPVIEVEKKVYSFEVRIKGNQQINTEPFTRYIEFTNQNSFIDIDGITATHRNGGAGDSDGNWWDFWGDWWSWANSDDLENVRVYITNRSLAEDKRTVSGNVVVETWDPERFNRSVITIGVPICSYTKETVAALAAYENSLQEHNMKLQAVNARASQYARLKRDELIEKYQNEFELKKEAFRALIARIFIDTDRRHHSYYEEVISRCINWDEAAISLESQPMDQLPYHHLPPNHFMNCPAIRFFLPVYKAAEATFFEAIKAGGITYHEASAQKVRNYLKGYRDMIANWKQTNSAKLVLDEYDSELVIGHHLEAVLSAYDFSN